MITLTDESPMPFGMHKGKKMEDVPASYFHWLWTNWMNPMCNPKRRLWEKKPVPEYIYRNLEVLKAEYPDKPWEYSGREPRIGAPCEPEE
jgi:hypothetical protein